MADSTNRRSFWVTLPGILTGIGGVIAAIATLVGVLTASGSIDGIPGIDNNRPPVVGEITLEYLPPVPGQSLTAQVAVSDPEHDRLEINWATTVGTFPEGSSGKIVRYKPPQTGASFQLTVEVSDGHNGTIGRSTSFQLATTSPIPPQTPTIPRPPTFIPTPTPAPITTHTPTPTLSPTPAPTPLPVIFGWYFDQSGPIVDPGVRAAIGSAVDEKTLTADFALQPPLVYLPDWPFLVKREQYYDPERARVLLAMSGYDTGAIEDTICVQIQLSQGTELEVAKAITTFLREVGARADLNGTSCGGGAIYLLRK